MFKWQLTLAFNLLLGVFRMGNYWTMKWTTNSHGRIGSNEYRCHFTNEFVYTTLWRRGATYGLYTYINKRHY